MAIRTANTLKAASGELPLSTETIEARSASLRERKKALLKELLDSEALKADSGANSSPAHYDREHAARRLASGETDIVRRPPQPARTPATIRMEMEDIESALRILSDERAVIARARFHSEMERRGPEWRSLLRETAMTVLKLQRLNRDRHRIAKEIKGKDAMQRILGEIINETHLLGFGYVRSGEVDEFLRVLISSGIITVDEIARTRGDEKERF